MNQKNIPIVIKCKHVATRTTPSPAKFLLYGCRLKKLEFGTENMAQEKTPKTCKEFEKR